MMWFRDFPKKKEWEDISVSIISLTNKLPREAKIFYHLCQAHRGGGCLERHLFCCVLRVAGDDYDARWCMHDFALHPKALTQTFEKWFVGHDLHTGVVVCGAGPLRPQLSGCLPCPQPPTLITNLTVHGFHTEATQKSI